MRQADGRGMEMGDVQQEQALTLELSPSAAARSNNEEGKIKGDSSNKEGKRWVQTCQHLPSTWLHSPLLWA